MRWKRLKLVTAGTVVAVLTGYIALHPFVLYKTWGALYGDIDVRSGDLRERRYGFGILLEDRIQTTPFSQSARELDLAGDRPPLWLPAWKTPVGLPALIPRTYDAYGFAGGEAVADCKMLMMIHSMENPDFETRSKDIRQFLQLMQEGDAHKMSRFIVERSESSPGGQESGKDYR